MENSLTKHHQGKNSKNTIFIKMNFSNIILVLNCMLISMQKSVFNLIYYILSYIQKYGISQVINLYFSPNSSYGPGLQAEYLKKIIIFIPLFKWLIQGTWVIFRLSSVKLAMNWQLLFLVLVFYFVAITIERAIIHSWFYFFTHKINLNLNLSKQFN